MNEQNPLQITQQVPQTVLSTSNNQAQENTAAAQTSVVVAPQGNAVPQELVALAHSGEDNTKVDFEATSSKYKTKFLKIISFGLSVQGAYHLYESLRFILVEAPEFSELLSSGHINRDEIIILSSKAIIQFLTASLSLFLALHITKLSDETIEDIHLLLAVILFFTNALIIDFFRQIEVDIVLSDVTRIFLEYFLTLPQRFIEFIPFL